MVSSARSLCCLPSSKLQGGTSISQCDLCSSDATVSAPSLCAQQCAVQYKEIFHRNRFLREYTFWRTKPMSVPIVPPECVSYSVVKSSGCIHTGLHLDAACCLNRVDMTTAVAEPHQHASFLYPLSRSGQALTRCSDMHQRLAELWVCVSTRLCTCARAISILTKLSSTKYTKHRLLSTDKFDLGY
jgi:hypothetical protein